jgi:GTP-binding protein
MVHHAAHPGRAAGDAGQDLDGAAAEAARLEAGRLLFAGECRFVYAAQRLDQLPAQGLPEVAFAGRSNVGKSSLINALTGRRALARASNTPGRTRQLNFFDLADRLTLVDMPGYGYAQAGKQVKADWQGLMFDYLRGRPTLRRVVLLLDSRVEVKESDRAVMGLLDRAAVAYQIVLTKADGVTAAALAAKQAEAEALARKHPAAFPLVLATSAEKRTGFEALRAELAGFAESPTAG